MTMKDAFTQNPDHECFFKSLFIYVRPLTYNSPETLVQHMSCWWYFARPALFSFTHQIALLRIFLNAIVFVKSVNLTKPFHAVFIVLQINQSLPLYVQFLTTVRHLVVKRNSTDKNPLCAFRYPQILFILLYTSIIQTHELHGSNNAPFSLWSGVHLSRSQSHPHSCQS